MAKILGYPLVNAVAIPVLLVIALNAWKLLARPGDPAPEDRMYGLDLVVVAMAYQLSELGLFYHGERTHPDVDYSFVVNFSWIMVGLLVVVMFALVVFLRRLGYKRLAPGLWELQEVPRVVINRVGLGTLIVVFLLNYNVDKVYTAWTSGIGELLR